MRTVVFDLDGTLADTSGDLLAAANACLAAPVLGPADALVAFQGGRAMLRLGYERLGVVGDLERDFPRLLAAYRDGICVQTRLYPGVVAALDRLRAAGFATAICTNKPEALAVDLVRRLGISGLFGALVGADSLPVRKPDPAPYRLAVERAGGGRSMLVGDTETDRLTGRAAGVPVALVTFGPEGRGVERFEPEGLLDHFDDLAVLVDRWMGPAAHPT